jgi:hypothetical protein
MAVISFDNKAECVWGGAGWAFRQTLRDLSAYAQGDAEFEAALERAGHLGSLLVDNLDADLKARITRAIESMCRGVLDGTQPSSIKEFHPDRGTQELYRRELKVLLSAVNASSRESRTEIRVQVNGPRPPCAQVAEHLWGAGVDFDSDGDSTSPSDLHWKELTVERRVPPGERIDIDPVSDVPLVLKVVASSQSLARRAAEFLRDRTNGHLIDQNLPIGNRLDLLQKGQLTVREIADFAADAGTENFIEAEADVNGLLDHSDPIVRYNTMATLAYEWGRSSRTDRIREILFTDEDHDCRRQAAGALGSLFRGKRDKPVLDALVHTAKNTKEPMDLRSFAYTGALDVIGVSRNIQPNPYALQLGPDELLALDGYLKALR